LGVRYIKSGEVGAGGEAVQRVYLVVGEPDLLQRAGDVFEFLDLTQQQQQQHSITSQINYCMFLYLYYLLYQVPA
jgi:hypothetical protein